MKLSLTNSPIDFIVLIVHAHLEALKRFNIGFVLTLSHPSDAALRTARRTPGGSALPAVGATQNLDEKDVFKTSEDSRQKRTNYSLLATHYSLKKIQLLKTHCP